MFYTASVFNQDISSTIFTDMTQMFTGAIAFNQSGATCSLVRLMGTLKNAGARARGPVRAARELLFLAPTAQTGGVISAVCVVIQ
jgi:hypothetical protein